ncbi:S66 peptidase family protein [Flavobacterium limnophilum]|uniref:S66 peptidase family protein n=1 Tax=Flavobacterium limnophilum TaxID=3003262 RepID=UPI003D794783
MRTIQFSCLNGIAVFYKLPILIFIFQTVNIQAQTPMKIPPSLQKGDTIALLATARKNIDDNLKPAIDLLHSWGLEVVIGSSIGLDNNQLAGTDEQRAADFQQQMDNPNIKAIWCVRGGYGTVRMIDLLDFTRFKQNPKWIVGFSDVTVIHSYVNKLNIATIHGAMPITVGKASVESIESLRKALFGESLEYEMPFNTENRLGNAKGEIVGGNLSILYSLMGSNAQIDCKGKILFIEDLDEYLYHIDRMMMSLKRCGCFDGLNGLIVGTMTKMKDNDIPWGKNANQIIADVIKEYSFPVFYNFPAGHFHDNRALIFGKQVSLELNATTSKVIFE